MKSNRSKADEGKEKEPKRGKEPGMETSIQIVRERLNSFPDLLQLPSLPLFFFFSLAESLYFKDGWLLQTISTRSMIFQSGNGASSWWNQSTVDLERCHSRFTRFDRADRGGKQCLSFGFSRVQGCLGDSCRFPQDYLGSEKLSILRKSRR